MGVFLGLGYTELAQTGLGDGFAKGVLHFFLGEEDMKSGERSVVRSKGAVVQGNGVHAFFGHVVLCEHVGELAGAVVAEVVEDYGIAGLDLGEGLAVFGDHDGLDEFVGDVGVVGCLDALKGAFELCTFALDKHVVGFLDAVPALVTVHGVESAADGGHAAGGLRHLLFQFLYESIAAAGIGVASVHETVHVHL